MECKDIDKQLSDRQKIDLKYNSLLKSMGNRRTITDSRQLPPKQQEPSSPVRLVSNVSANRNIKHIAKPNIQPIIIRSSIVEEHENVAGDNVRANDDRIRDENYDWLFSPEADNLIISAQSSTYSDIEYSTPLWKNNITDVTQFLQRTTMLSSVNEEALKVYNQLEANKNTILNGIKDNTAMKTYENLVAILIKQMILQDQIGSKQKTNNELWGGISTYTKQLIVTAEQCVSDLLDIGEEERRIRTQLVDSQSVVHQIVKSLSTNESVSKEIEECRTKVTDIKSRIDSVESQLLFEKQRKGEIILKSENDVKKIVSIGHEIKTRKDINNLILDRRQNYSAALHFVEVFSLRLLHKCFLALRRNARRGRRICEFQSTRVSKQRLVMLRFCYFSWRQYVKVLKIGKQLTFRVKRKVGRKFFAIWLSCWKCKRKVLVLDNMQLLSQLKLRKSFASLRNWKDSCKIRRKIAAKENIYITLFTMVRVLRHLRLFNESEAIRSQSIWFTLWQSRLHRILLGWRKCVVKHRMESAQRTKQLLILSRRNSFKQFFNCWLNLYRFRCHLLLFKQKQLGLQGLKRAVFIFCKQSNASLRTRIYCAEKCGRGSQESLNLTNKNALRLIQIKIAFRRMRKVLKDSHHRSIALETISSRVIDRLTRNSFEMWVFSKKRKAHELHCMERVVSHSSNCRMLRDALRSWYFLWQCGPPECRLRFVRPLSCLPMNPKPELSTSLQCTSIFGQSTLAELSLSEDNLIAVPCYPCDELDDSDNDEGTAIQDVDNVDMFGCAPLTNLMECSMNDEDGLILSSHRIWLRAAIHRWRNNCCRLVNLRLKAISVQKICNVAKTRNSFGYLHSKWLSSAAQKLNLMTQEVGKQNKMEDDSSHYEYQVVKEKNTSGLIVNKEIAFQLQLQIDEVEALLSQVICEIGSVVAVERDVNASIDALNTQCNQANQRHDSLLVRLGELQLIKENVQNNSVQLSVELPTLPQVEKLTAEHKENRLLLMRDVEDFYLKAVNIQAEMNNQRESMAIKTSSVVKQMKQDQELLGVLHANIDKLNFNRQTTEKETKNCMTLLENNTCKVSEEINRKNIISANLESEKLKLEEKLKTLAEQEALLRRQIENYESLNTTTNIGIDRQSVTQKSFFPKNLAEYDLLSLDYLNSSIAINEVDVETPLIIEHEPVAEHEGTILTEPTDSCEFAGRIALVNDKENIRNGTGLESVVSRKKSLNKSDVKKKSITALATRSGSKSIPLKRSKLDKKLTSEGRIVDQIEAIHQRIADRLNSSVIPHSTHYSIKT